MVNYYGTLILFSVLTQLILVVMIGRSNTLAEKTKRGLCLTSLLIALAACAEGAGVFCNGGDLSLRGLHMAVKFLELSIAPVIPVVCGCAIYPIRAKWALAVPLALHVVIEFASMWYGIVFYVDAANVYHHCTWYGIYYCAYFSGLIFLSVQATRFCRRYQNQNTLSLILVMAFILMGILIQALDGTVRMAWVAAAVGDVLFYIYYSDLLQQIDPLTELLNRRNYENRIDKISRPLVILQADINDFKAVNDQYGHPVGDECLRLVGQALKRTYGKGGLCYRVGGDEFCVLLERHADSVQSLTVAFYRMLDQMRLLSPWLPRVSVGYAPFDPAQMDIAQAVAQADREMYQVKEHQKQ